MRILLIEPDYVLAETYFAALTRAGHQLTVCSGAQAAILAADRQTPDLVILELQLVEHSGIEFLYEFRSYPEWQNIPVFIHTVVPPAEFNTSWKLLEHELGMRRYLYKAHTRLNDLIGHVNLISLATSETQ